MSFKFMLKELKKHKYAYLHLGDVMIRVHYERGLTYEKRSKDSDEWIKCRQLSIYKHYGSWSWEENKIAKGDLNEQISTDCVLV